MCQKFPGGTGEENKKVSGLAATQLCRTEVHSHVGTIAQLQPIGITGTKTASRSA